MTDQTECRPGTIATIGLPADMAVVSAIVAGAARIDPEVRAVSHGGHLDLYGPAEAAQDGQERPGSASGDAGACGGGCEAAGALRRDVMALTTALAESTDARDRMLTENERLRRRLDGGTNENEGD